jgi:hypothetical protein
MNRRNFLRLAGITVGTIAIGGIGLTVVNEINKDPIITIKEILYKKLSQRFGQGVGNELSKNIDSEYQITYSQLPDIGTVEENKWAVYMPPTSLALAAYRILVPNNLNLEQFGLLFFETIREQMNNISSSAMRIIGTDQGMKEKTKILAERSQRRKYKDDWVISFVEGDGKNYTYGMNVTECAILKYLTLQGAPGLTRYLCLTDYITSEAIGRGLVRNKTLAEGCDCCDFRYKQGRPSYLYPLRNGWPPKFIENVSS